MQHTIADLPDAVHCPINDIGRAQHFLLIMFETYGFDYSPSSQASANMNGTAYGRLLCLPLFSPKACTLLDQRNAELYALESADWKVCHALNALS